MNYKDIIKSLFSAENEQFIPDGMAYSEAMCVHTDEGLFDIFFLYAVTNDRKKCSAPIAALALHAESGKIVGFEEYEEYNEFDLTNTNNDNKVIAALETYEELYPLVKELLCKDKLDENDLKIIRSFNDAFLVFANTEMQKVYRAICPQMFAFIEKYI